jgi:ABC-type sugar transport system permease subunit
MSTATATGSTAATTTPLSPRTRLLARWAGLLAIIAGIIMIVAGGVVWGVVSSQLADQHITVSEDASFLANAPVTGPFSALAQADAINMHATAMADGKTYAQLEKDDPIRATVMDASFLRASLFTSVVSFGVAFFAIGVGIILALLGWATTALSRAVPATAR